MNSKKDVNVSDPHFRALILALEEGSSVTVSALEYTLHALCVLADEAVEGGGKLLIRNSEKLTDEETIAIVDFGKRHVILL